MTVAERRSAYESPLALVARVVAIFAIVGAGIGGATLIFLSATGFFDATASSDLEAIGDLFLGGIALATILVVSLVVGIVLAAVGGLYAGSRSPDRAISTAVGAIAGTLGHAALVAALGLFLIVGVDALDSDEAEPAPTPVPTQSAEDIASCEQAFGAGSELCGNEATEESTEGGGVSFEDIWRIGLGLIPAAAVGGLSGAVGFTRRSLVPIADVPVIVEAQRRAESSSNVRVGPRPRRAKPSPRKTKPTARKPATRRPPPESDDETAEPTDVLTAGPSEALTDDLSGDRPELPPE